MIAEPRSLPATATAREAGEVLTPPEVRAVYVVDDDGGLVGVVTRKTLVARVVAEGRDPGATALRDLAEPAVLHDRCGNALDEAFRFIEERDAERVPVVDGGRLVGVVSRAVLAAPARRGRGSARAGRGLTALHGPDVCATRSFASSSRRGSSASSRRSSRGGVHAVAVWLAEHEGAIVFATYAEAGR